MCIFYRIIFCVSIILTAKLAYFLNYEEYLADKILLSTFAAEKKHFCRQWGRMQTVIITHNIKEREIKT